MFTVSVYSEMDNKADTFNPISSSIKVKFLFGCHDGNHHIGNGFCGEFECIHKLY